MQNENLQTSPGASKAETEKTETQATETEVTPTAGKSETPETEKTETEKTETKTSEKGAATKPGGGKPKPSTSKPVASKAEVEKTEVEKTEVEKTEVEKTEVETPETPELVIPEKVALFTDIQGLRPGKISMFGPATKDFVAEFDNDGKAVVPIDVAAANISSKKEREEKPELGRTGFWVLSEDLEAVESVELRARELAEAPVAAYDAGDSVKLTVKEFAGCPNPIIAGDNLPVSFDVRGVAVCGEKTAQSFLENFPDATIEAFED